MKLVAEAAEGSRKTQKNICFLCAFRVISWSL